MNNFSFALFARMKIFIKQKLFTCYWMAGIFIVWNIYLYPIWCVCANRRKNTFGIIMFFNLNFFWICISHINMYMCLIYLWLPRNLYMFCFRFNSRFYRIFCVFIQRFFFWRSIQFLCKIKTGRKKLCTRYKYNIPSL